MCVVLLALGLCEAKKGQHEADIDDNDFAEFEDFDDDEGQYYLTPDLAGEERRWNLLFIEVQEELHVVLSSWAQLQHRFNVFSSPVQNY